MARWPVLVLPIRSGNLARVTFDYRALSNT